MDRSDMRDLFQAVALRPRMWLPDLRFTTVVAFISGVDATNIGFGQSLSHWAAQRYLGTESSIVWFGLIAEHLLGDACPVNLGDLDESASEPLVAELFSLLDEFLA